MKEKMRPFVSKFVFLIKEKTGFMLPERIFRHLHFRGEYDVEIVNGRKITMYSWGNRVENELAWRGWDGHEPVERRRWAKMVEGGGDILDIGANTATFAITAKALSPGSRVFAFEPVDRIAEMARKNVAVSGMDVTVVCTAVARSEGELPIYDPGGENAYSASLDPDFLNSQKESYIVPVISIDGFCRENGLNPTAIKLDVEGLEGEAICGAAEILGRGRCIILCEWRGVEWHKYSEPHAEACVILNEKGYVALDIHDLVPVDLGKTRTHGDLNVLLVHRSMVQTIIETWPRLERQ